MTKKIEFISTSEYAWNVIEKASPSSKFIPRWYREMEPYHGGKLRVLTGLSTASPKKCVPMLDALRSGYMIPLWSDIMIEENEESGFNINWRVSQKMFEDHGSDSTSLPAPKECYPHSLKYLSNLMIKTPRGFSILVTQPAGHYDLPFQIIPAVIDSDRPTVDLAFPLWVKRGYSGIFEKGTPVVQIIPFKRDNWKADFDFISDKEFQMQMEKNTKTTIKNNYLKNTWSKKDYK